MWVITVAYETNEGEEGPDGIRRKTADAHQISDKQLESLRGDPEEMIAFLAVARYRNVKEVLMRNRS